jgi:hypothetical protein
MAQLFPAWAMDGPLREAWIKLLLPLNSEYANDAVRAGWEKSRFGNKLTPAEFMAEYRAISELHKPNHTTTDATPHYTGVWIQCQNGPSRGWFTPIGLGLSASVDWLVDQAIKLAIPRAQALYGGTWQVIREATRSQMIESQRWLATQPDVQEIPNGQA